MTHLTHATRLLAIKLDSTLGEAEDAIRTMCVKAGCDVEEMAERLTERLIDGTCPFCDGGGCGMCEKDTA